MKRFFIPFGLRPTDKKPEEVGPRYADMQVRAVAAAIDLVLLFQIFYRPFDTITATLYTGLNYDLLKQVPTEQDPGRIIALLLQAQLPQLWLLNALIQVLLIGVVYIGVQWWFGNTPGKWLLGLEIRRDDAVERPTKWQYFVRYLAYIPSAAVLMLGFIWMGFNTRRRGWHDMVANTVVVHRYPRGWAWSQVKAGYRRLREKYHAGNRINPVD
jgi:uncharacterized RDD family membrane protein YckC